MLVLRNLRILTKIKPNNVANAQFVLQRALRGLPRQRNEFLELNQPAEDQKADAHATAAPATEGQDSKLADTTSKYAATALETNTHSKKYKNKFALSAEADAPGDQLPAITDADDDAQLPSTELAKKDYVPTFNLAAYVKSSATLQQFIQLGVDLNSIERRKGLAEFVLRLDFERDVKPYLFFLQDQGVAPDVFGTLITKNPLLFKIDLDDLQTRVDYLKSKNFTAQERQRIFTKNPYWLMFSTRRIDQRLGYFQKEFRLSGADVRFLASKQPRLITYNMEHIRKSTFCIREEMGFDADEMKCLLLSKPRLWMSKSDDLVERFAYAHKEMQLSHELLIQFPEVLSSREFRLRQRHEFLKMLGRAHYDPQHDMFISPKTLVEGNDRQFVQHVAKSDIRTYELFLKSR